MDSNMPDEVFDPGYEAYQLSVAGMPWPEIAERTGYPTTEAAELGAKVHRQKQALRLQQQDRAERLAVMMDKLDREYAFWAQKSRDGDDRAAALVLRNLSQQARILGLDDVEKDKGNAGKTILVMGTQSDYIKALQELSGSAMGPQEDNDEESTDGNN